MVIVVAITRDGRDLFEVYMDTNPFVHTFAIMVAAGARNAPDRYPWVGLGRAHVVESTIWMLACMVGYMLLGAVFAWRAKCRFRRNVF
jgi:hypothetical protein